MRLSSYIPAVLALLVAAVMSVTVAVLAVDRIEDNAERRVNSLLMTDAQDWASVRVDRLKVHLSGTAEDEATRFKALRLAGRVVDATRVIDEIDVAAAAEIEPPRFSIEILRNDAGISLIGLVPVAMDREAMAQTIGELAGGADVADLLETADHPIPAGWVEAISFGLNALAQLPRSKISVAADSVEINAIADSGPEKRLLEASLKREAPADIALELDISAPRLVITPFTLRFLIDENGARFDACSAHTEEGRAAILAAAAEAGLQGKATCVLGLGVPSPSWPDAVTSGIGALAELGGGSLTFSDADVSLVALDSVDEVQFDTAVGKLEAELPEVFSLSAVRPEPVMIDGTGEDSEDGPPEFVATKSPEGLLQLRGKVSDERQRNAVEGFAHARFVGADVQAAMRADDALPDGWAGRVFAGLAALAVLNNGILVVQPEFLDIRGNAGDRNAQADVSRILSDQLGEAEHFSIKVTYVEALDPEINLPTPEECVDRINAILAAQKVSFEPGSADIDPVGLKTIDRIAEMMKDCSDVPMEIGGHTDSQGREVMNQALSQQRAEAVLNALQARRVLTGNLTPTGFGEAVPIADNGTEEGREANRRIEFTLIITGEPEPEGEDAQAEGDGHDHGAEEAATETDEGTDGSN